MPGVEEIKQQVALESARRARLGVPAVAGGVLYILSGAIISSTLGGAPTVGLLQGLVPALRGEPNPAVSPRAVEVKFISHHAFALIAGSTLAAIAIGLLTLVLLLLLEATRFRRPGTWRQARSLILFGGVAVAVVSVGHQVVGAIETHNFAVGHDLTNHAVDQALTKGTANIVTEYLDLLAGLALAAGMIATMVNAMRVGLITRWMGILGIFTGVLVFLPLGGATLGFVPAFWLLAMGFLYLGRWPNGDPPAWAAGEARPWPSQAELRAKQAAEREGSSKRAKPPLARVEGDLVPEPAPPVSGSSRRRRRKRGARR
jgi:hypothetical protein